MGYADTIYILMQKTKNLVFGDLKSTLSFSLLWSPSLRQNFLQAILNSFLLFLKFCNAYNNSHIQNNKILSLLNWL